MSVFSEINLSIPQNEVIVQLAISHVIINPTLAVTTKQKIYFYNDNGDKLDFELARNISPTYIDWHPNLPTLAIGWETGLITLWSEESKMAKEEANVHKGLIINIKFNPAGTRMCTSDDQGLVAVWRGINCIATYKREDRITHCTFCDLNFQDSKKKDKPQKTNNLFFIGGKSGVVCLADDSKHCSEVCKVGGSIKSLLFYEKENSVIIITSTLLLVQFKISQHEKSAPDKKVKLSISGDPEKLNSIWVGNTLLATCSQENILRMWHIESDENYVLTLLDNEAEEESNNPQSQSANLRNDKILSIQYEPKGKVLVGGTSTGKVVFWKNLCIGSASPQDTDQWKLMPHIQVDDEAIQSICIGQNNGVIAVKSSAINLSIITETVIRGQMSENVKVLQTSSKKVQIYLQNDHLNSKFSNKETDVVLLFDAKDNIKGLDCSNDHLLIWAGKVIEVHEFIKNLDSASTSQISSFSDQCIQVGIQKESCIIVKESSINITNFKGVVKQTITFTESEGKIAHMNMLNDFMVVFTKNNYLKIFDMSRRQLRQVGSTRKFEDSKGVLGELRQCMINADGSKVAILCDQRVSKTELLADTKFYIYDVEMDSFLSHELGPKRAPIDIFWDKTDKRYFAVVADYMKTSQVDIAANIDHAQLNIDEKANLLLQEEYKGKEIRTYFCTSEIGIKQQDSFKLKKEIEGVFALCVPKIYYIIRTFKSDPGTSYKIIGKKLKDFSGLERIDNTVVQAVMNFSFYLTTGNLDEAYKSVKAIEDPLIWENMAQMCVKTRRLDVAEICIGNMRFGRGAKAIREAKKEEQLEAQLAMVAIQLNMKDEAKNLYEQSKRYDLINKMYQASGEWEKSVQIAETYDRINLKNTYYKTAKLLEISRDFEKAIEFYEKSGTHKKEVPRMLMNAGELQLFEQYMEDKHDLDLYCWWAQYQESQGNFELAQKYYKMANNNAALVRLLIFQGNFQRSKEICNVSQDTTACYYLAKQFEMQDNVNEAIYYYEKAQYYSQAVRLARENGKDSEIMSLSLMAPPQVMNQSALYFEQKGHTEKAIILYSKAKNFKKSLDLAIKAKLYNYIEKITGEVNEDTDAEVLKKIAGIFMENGQMKQALDLLLAAKQTDKALDIFIEHNIQITNEALQKLLPPIDSNNSADKKKREDLSKIIANKAKKQGNYEVACQLYIELGMPIKTCKCLIKLGNIEKVISFAQNARMNEVYILAANFLQNCDWHKNSEIMKQIVYFYSKAKSFNHLAGFYDACSQVEIDEYRDYEKALSALKDALKYAKKSTSEDTEAKIQMLQQKCFIIEKFIQSKQLIKQNPQEMMKICQQLIDNPNVESAIRQGDVFAQMIEFLYEQQNYQAAYQLIQKMEERNIILTPFLDKDMTQTIFSALGIKKQPQGQQSRNLENKKQQQQQQDDDDNVSDDVIGEEIN